VPAVVVLARQAAAFAACPERVVAAVPARQAAAFAACLERVMAAVPARQAAVFAACLVLAACSAVGSAQRAAAWKAPSAALSVERAGLAGPDGQNRPADGHPAVAPRVGPARMAERLAVSAVQAVLIAARAQAVANAVVAPAAVEEVAVLLSPAVAEEAALLSSAAEAGLPVARAARLAVVARAASQPEALLLARERRPEVFWARRQAVRQDQVLAPALARGGSSTDRPQACRRTLRRRPEWYWSSAADGALSLSMSLEMVSGKFRATLRTAAVFDSRA
jgi:hypothetical protein